MKLLFGEVGAGALLLRDEHSWSLAGTGTDSLIESLFGYQRMAPTVQPPPSLPIEPSGHLIATPLASILGQLNGMIFGIALPKTKAAKLATISLAALHQSCDLIFLAQLALKDPHPDPQLDNINKQLEEISAHIGLPNAFQSVSKCTYISVLSSPASSALPPPPDAKMPFHST